MYERSEDYRSWREEDYRQGRGNFLTRTYGIMALGLLVTFAVSWMVAKYCPWLIYNSFVVVLILIAELATVWAFSRRIATASYSGAIGMFLFYSVLTGVTFSSIFLLFDMNSISMCFLASGTAFGVMALVGHNTRTDLSPMRGILLGGLIAIIALSLLGLLFRLAGLDILICCVGVVIFLGLTAYDTQKMEQMYESAAGTPMENNLAVFGALQLYLDFVNLFHYILLLFGNRNRR